MKKNTIMGIMGRLIVQENGCCTWPGVKNRTGYGRVRYGGNWFQVHRLLYEHFVGPIPDGYQIDHFHCNNPSCANFAHLKAVTPRENTMRSGAASAVNARKTHCKNGHPFEGDNFYVTRWGYRWCRLCEVDRSRRRTLADRERKKAEGTYLERGENLRRARS